MPFKGKKLPTKMLRSYPTGSRLEFPIGENAADPDTISRAEAEKHWAFRTLYGRGSLQRHAMSKNPIDAFLAAEQEKRGVVAAA